MPRNRYTKTVHKQCRAQLAAQQKALTRLARLLRGKTAESIELPLTDPYKDRRRGRLEQNWQHKPVRSSVATSETSPQQLGGTPMSESTHTLKYQTISSASGQSRRRHSHTIQFLVGVLITVITLAGCGSNSSPQSELATDQAILSTCDPSAPPASMVEIDGTGSSAAPTIFAARMTALQSIVRRTVICSGRLRVIVFSSSSVATATLFDGSLTMPGATSNARLLRVPSAVNSVMTQVRTAYGPAVAKLDAGGSDITAQYRNAAEWIAQIGHPYRLTLYLLTDGFQNIGVVLGSQVLSKQQAAALADQVTMPKLPGASIVVAGLGKVVGTPPPSSVAEELISYYSELCRIAGATQCTSVTDYEGQ